MGQNIVEADLMCHKPHVWSFVMDPGLSQTATYHQDCIIPAGELGMVSTSWEEEGGMG